MTDTPPAASRAETASKETWREALFNRRMLICIFTGFSSGLPLYLLLNLLPAWLRSESVDLRAIGLFALIQLPYTWKFLWSPLLDRYAVPLLGRRRGWMLVTQLALLAAIPGRAVTELTSVCRACQDLRPTEFKGLTLG